ncbi:hypothetical protein BT93_L0707 [Corymbia citriodora subsp. variegata]|uniref:Acyl-CoA synthetase n=1 Tax=Corymbia citriodora subsp. variegata TaxID=360336 RepID=A0A8T0CRW5_CORYI|nr:hypothetical protein BT93_L0707 [Corymbia citriodora subsp. variegata]
MSTKRLMEGMIRCSANYAPLTPISFLERAAVVYGDRPSIVYGDVRYTWQETFRRCIKLASALDGVGVSRGDVVVAFGPNVPAMYELHFAVPMAGAVLCTINTHFDAETVSGFLQKSEAKVIFVDRGLLHVMLGALDILSGSMIEQPRLIIIQDGPETSSDPQHLEYEHLLASGNLDFQVRRPEDEWDPISLSFTSGTTANPKGTVYSYRGAYLNSLVEALLNEMKSMPVYLWSVPMFHCNGWCLPWAIAAQGGTNVCLRDVTAKSIFENIAQHNVTHMGGAPAILNMIINAPASDQKPLPGKVRFMIGGAAPPPEVILRVEALGFWVTHCYGSTEAYGPATICTWKPEWDSLPPEERARMKTRQGVRHIGLEEVDIKDPVTMESVPSDGTTWGEIMLRGNTVMSGYFKNTKATEAAFEGGWFRTGDVGVKHPDGYIEVKDRAKDIIISGGENVSSIQVESMLFGHPAVFEAAVVGRPDDRLGEIPCAFVKLKDGFSVAEEEIIKYCRDNLPSFTAPMAVAFSDLPKTATGKTQKYVLREKAKAMG